MDNENKFKPAFPFVYKDQDGDQAFTNGLSKREYIATQILAGMANTLTVGNGLHATNLARFAVIVADQLLVELETE